MRVIFFLLDNPYLLVLAATPFLIAGQVYFLVRKMSEPEKMLVPLNGLRADYQLTLNKYTVRSIPLYPFLALYWYFVSRSRAAGRSIQQQFP